MEARSSAHKLGHNSQWQLKVVFGGWVGGREGGREGGRCLVTKQCELQGRNSVLNNVSGYFFRSTLMIKYSEGVVHHNMFRCHLE